MNFNTFKVLLP